MICVYSILRAPEGSTKSGSGEAGNPKPILTNIISLLLGEPSNQGLFYTLFAFPKLNIILPNIILNVITKSMKVLVHIRICLVQGRSINLRAGYSNHF